MDANESHLLYESLGILTSEISDVSAEGIAKSVGALISQGKLKPGDLLPPVRRLADELAVSPATVSSAWQKLRVVGVIRTDGRRGTTVCTQSSSAGTTRLSELQRENTGAILDLSQAVPDPLLLPNFKEGLLQLSLEHKMTNYFEPQVVPELENIIRSSQPFESEMLMLTNGAMDAIDRILSLIVRPGTVVAVENPTFSPILDLLDKNHANIIGIETDDDGIDPDSLKSAMARHKIELLLHQPHANNPSGHSMTYERELELSKIIHTSKATIVEIDHSFGIHTGDPTTLGRHFPDRTLYVRGFSKAYGPDLRMASVSGPKKLINPLIQQRQLGPSWTSRLLQSLLLFLLSDENSQRTVAFAKEQYAYRRENLLAELKRREVEVRGKTGTNIWVSVKNENNALMYLALQGIIATPGSAFKASSTNQQHIRIACGQVTSNFDLLAEKIATAAN